MKLKLKLIKTKTKPILNNNLSETSNPLMNLNKIEKINMEHIVIHSLALLFDSFKVSRK